MFYYFMLLFYAIILVSNYFFHYSLQYDASKNNRNATPIYGPFEKLFISDWGQSQIHHNIIQVYNYFYFQLKL